METIIRWHVEALSAFAQLQARARADRERGEITSQVFMIGALVVLALAAVAALTIVVQREISRL